ncbi:Golgi-associated plant pathogenesis-related protein 1, partial [Stegodyphus mimosarum]
MDQPEDWDDSCFYPPDNKLTLDVEAFRQDMVSAHNRYRQLHESPPLTTLQELEDDAQIWAETIAAKGHLEYCEHLHNIGENLCSIDLITSVPSAKEIVRNWYKEIKQYSFAEPRWRRGAFHLTQILWRSTTHIGIGIAPVPGEPRLFVVVRYFPAGNSNFPGEFQKNVRPRMSLSSTESSNWSQEDYSFVRTYSGRLRSFAEDAYI